MRNTQILLSKKETHLRVPTLLKSISKWHLLISSHKKSQRGWYLKRKENEVSVTFFLKNNKDEESHLTMRTRHKRYFSSKNVSPTQEDRSCRITYLFFPTYSPFTVDERSKCSFTSSSHIKKQLSIS